MANISRAFYADYTAAKQSIRNAAKPVICQRLTKAGVPSKMTEDTRYFSTVAEAERFVAQVEELNPTRGYKFSITVR